MNNEFEENGFEERADYIDKDFLLKWNVDISYFNSIQKKLTEKGAKVLVGPRGTGKTHQMKIAYNSCLTEKSKPFPVYVSFSKYYYLEPLLSKNPAAITVFHTWVLCKILIGCVDSINKMVPNYSANSFIESMNLNSISYSDIEKFVAQSEKNIQESWHSDIIRNITLHFVTNFISHLMSLTKRKRAILLLDDAALTLTKEYMIEFFDIFRSLKTTYISPKASVYPGTTEYGPRFHLKQDGDPFNIWFDPEGDSYSEFIDQLCEKRFENKKIDENVKELLKYASFGNPRAFITLLRDLEESTLSKRNSFQALFNSIIDTRCKLMKDEYLSIKQKLNQYSTIIDTGWDFFESILIEITNANKKALTEIVDKKVVIGFLNTSETSSNKFIDRMIRFLIEAGLLYELSPVKHGENREYNRYIPHFLFLFQKRAFSKSKGFNINEILLFLKRKNSKHPIRKDNIHSFLGEEILDNLKLDLPACSNCGAIRLSENQRFCHSCGTQLISKSSFEQCMQLTIDQIPLTEWQKEKIKKETSLKTVKDFISNSNIGDELRKPHGFGEKKAEKIVKIVNKLIEEFLA